MAPARSSDRGRARAPFWRWAAAVLLGLLGLGLGPRAPCARAEAANGGWILCNETSYIVEVAFGRPAGPQVTVKGWLRFRPGECRYLLTGPLQTATHYLYARASDAHRGGQREWGGTTNFCVDSRINFEAAASDSCAVGTQEIRGFRAIAIARKGGWRTRLTQVESFSSAEARNAGIQRLLNDAGYDTKESDGILGRRSLAALARFKADAKLAANAGDEAVIDALEASARDWGRTTGLTLCNRTPNPIFAAFARQRGETWESRGWWRLGAGACARVLNEALTQPSYYVYAVMDSAAGDRLLSAAREEFCLAQSRFVITGRAACEEREFDAAPFMEVRPAGAETLQVELFDRDFSAPATKKPAIAQRTAANGSLPPTASPPAAPPGIARSGTAPKP